MLTFTRYTKETIREFIEKGYWLEKGYVDFLEEHARRNPEKICVIDDKGHYTYEDVEKMAKRIALKFIELGIERGAPIVIELPDCVENFAVRLACEYAGLPYCAIPRTFRHTEVKHVLNTTGAVGFVIPHIFRDFDYLEMIRELRAELPNLKHIFIVWEEEVPEDTISIERIKKEPIEERLSPEILKERKLNPCWEIGYLTSTTGTTGLPKVAQAPLAARISALVQHVEEWKITSEDIIGTIAPLSGAVGHTVGFGCALVAGATTVLRAHYTPDSVLQTLQDEKVTFATMVPAQLAWVVDHPELNKYDLSSLRAIRVGGGYLPPELAKRAEEKLGVEILIGYGGTDFGSITSVPAGAPPEVRRSTVGRPLPGNICKVVDDEGRELPPGEIGEIVVKSVSAPDGYIGMPEEMAKVYDEQGFARTGDMGKFTEDGWLMIVGRKKDIIIRGGQNIYPGEIENLLMTHPKVLNAAVVGMPDPVMGERVCAFVIPKPGETFTFEEMVEFLKNAKLAPFKIPERLVIKEEFPLAGGIKVDKKALRAEIEEILRKEGKL